MRSFKNNLINSKSIISILVGMSVHLMAQAAPIDIVQQTQLAGDATQYISHFSFSDNLNVNQDGRNSEEIAREYCLTRGYAGGLVSFRAQIETIDSRVSYYWSRSAFDKMPPPLVLVRATDINRLPYFRQAAIFTSIVCETDPTSPRARTEMVSDRVDSVSSGGGREPEGDGSTSYSTSTSGSAHSIK